MILLSQKKIVRVRRQQNTIEQIKKNRLRRRRTEMYFAFVFILIGIYLVGYFTTSRRPTIPQMRVEVGSIGSPSVFDAIIIRDEEVHTIPLNNNEEAIFNVDNNQRIQRNELIASVIDTERIFRYQADLLVLDQSAMDIQLSREGLLVNEQEIQDRNREIVRLVNSAVFDFSLNELNSLLPLVNNIGHNLNERNYLYFTDDSSMLDLSNARQLAALNIADASTSIHSPNSGIFSSFVDGLEHLSLSEVSTMSRTEFGNVATTNQSNEELAFRIINSNDWFITSYISSEYAHLQALNSTRIFVNFLNEVVPLDVEIYFMEQRGNEFFAIFRTNRSTLSFINARQISFRLTEVFPAGFVIPASAVVEVPQFIIPVEFTFVRNNLMMVELYSNGVGTPISVRGYRVGDYFYVFADIDGLRVGDILRSPDEDVFRISDIHTSLGVFNTNLGFASFVPINLLNSYSIDGYIVLDTSENPNIRLFDRIAVDASNVTEGQIIN